MSPLVLLALLQVADIGTTALGLERGLHEANPVLALAFASVGFWPSIGAAKLALVASAAVACRSRMGSLAVTSLCVLYLGIVTLNLAWIA